MGKTRERPGSRAEHKFEKKLEFYSKVREAVTSLSAQKSITKRSRNQRRREKKLKAYDLSTLYESLPELKAPRQLAQKDLNGKSKPLNGKARRELLLKEQERFLQSLSNPNDLLFQSDPIAAINHHILSTQPVVEEPPKKKVNKNGSLKRKEKKLKALIRPQGMDM